MTPYTAIFAAAQKATAALARDDMEAYKKHSAEVERLIDERLDEVCLGNHARYFPVKFEREPDEHLLSD